MLNKLALCLIVAAALALSACTIDVQGEEGIIRDQKRIPLTGMPNVTIRTFNGSVELRPWDRNEILVDVERRAASAADAKDIVVRTSEEGGNVLIEAVAPRRDRDLIHFGRWTSPSVRMVVTVPARLNVEAHSGDGSIAVRDINGRIQVSTGDGAVTLRHVQGEITIRTGDGSVSVNDADGTVAVSTGDGAVDVSGRFDALAAHSGDGGIRVDARPGSTMRREWTLTSGDGGMTLRVPADLNASVDAQTGDGPITTSGVIVTGPTEAREHGILRGQIGKGGEVLTLRTGDGAINIIAK